MGPSRPRYVPKGGYLIDFSERVTPKLRRLLEKEEREARRHTEACADNDPPEERGSGSGSGRERERESSTCTAMVLWSGDEGAAEKGVVSADVRRVDSNLPTAAFVAPLAGDGAHANHVGAVGSVTPDTSVAASATPRSSWKPPGCLRQPLWRRPNKAKARAKQGENANANAKSKTTAGRDGGQRSTTAPPTAPPTATLAAHPCPACHQHTQQQQALHLKAIRIESLAAKCSREMKEFEAYKEDELRRLAEMKEAFKAKKKRDALAQTAEARASSQHTDLARLRIKLEDIEGALAAQRLKHKGDKEKWALEGQRYRDEIAALKEEIGGLNELISSKNGTNGTLRKATGSANFNANFNANVGTDVDASGAAVGAAAGTFRKAAAASAGSIGTPSTPVDVSDGSTSVHVHHYDNNTVERRWNDGSSTVQYLYENGDVRQSDSSGIVEYLYAGVECWNTSYPDGDHVYYFKDGRRECHGADGTVQILVDGHHRAYGCCDGGSGTAAGIPVDKINPKLLQPCPRKL